MAAGTAFAFHAHMNGLTVSQALRHRFDSIRQTEIERLSKKLRGLSAADRQSLESITADIIRAIASVPERALAEHAPQPALDALVRLFALDAGPGPAGGHRAS